MTSELPITYIEEAEIEQIACEPYFVDINDILKREIKEEATEARSISEYGVSNESPKNNENRNFHDSNPDSSEFEVMLRDSLDLTESKFSPAHYWENMNFDGLATLKNEDHSECNDASLTNNVESKTKTLKNENDIDILHKDVKLEICEEKSSGSENGSYPNSINDILIKTEIGPEPNFTHELSKDSKICHQNIEEDGTAMKRDNNRRNGPTVTTNSKYCQVMQKLPHCKSNSKFYPFESEQIFNERPDTEKLLQCSFCPDSFVLKQTLLDHERAHSAEKPFQCRICLKSYSRKTHLATHEIIHTGEKPFQCKICPKWFCQKRHLEEHERFHTGEKPFQCKICLRSFSRKRVLMKHEITHTGERPFQCKICSKSFPHKGHLAEHERIHTGEKPFQCKICLKSFNTKSDLTRHERIHTGEKGYQCKICLKAFKQKGHLKIHERTHSGKGPVQCEICFKLFSRKVNLTVHERTHTTEKLFQCKICPKSYRTKWHLTRHERIHPEEKPF